MFSRRTRWNLAENRLAAALAAKRRSGVAVLDLTESNPTRAGLPYPEDILESLADPQALVYEPSPRGLESARAAVARDYRRRGFAVDPDHLFLTSSTSEAYAFLLKLLCDPEDEVLVPRPSYPLFEYLADLESVRALRYPLAYDGEWHLAVEAVARLMTPRTRALVLVNPNNPTGSFVKADEMAALRDLCAARDVALVSDEVFADYAEGHDPRRVTSVATEGPGLAFALGGLSKSCGLPQLKLGWIALAGSPGLRDEAAARLEVVADTYLSVSTPVQRAAPTLLARLPELQRPIAERVSQNRRTLRDRIGPGCPATLLAAEGGWYAVLQVPATCGEEERVLRLLERRDVLVHPGFFFDFDREAFLVLSLLPPPAVFEQAVARILEAL